MNRLAEEMQQDEKIIRLKEIKLGIYDGLIKDLLNAKAYSLCQVVYGEK